MIRSILRILFVTSLVVALLGGLALIGLQTVGLIIGVQTLVVDPNGVFKTLLCLAASISAVSAYLLTQVGSEADARADVGAPR